MNYLIAGLGNPGAKYLLTRHNIGFLSIDLLSDNLKIDVTKKYKKSLIGQKGLFEQNIILMKPQTYMNLSGTVIRSAMAKYRISLQQIIIIYDDIDLPLGKIRIKRKGASAGHKGLQSILDCLQNDDFIRIRIGIGSNKIVTIPSEQYVLDPFTKNELKVIQKALKKIPDIIRSIITESVEKAMNDFN